MPAVVVLAARRRQEVGLRTQASGERGGAMEQWSTVPEEGLTTLLPLQSAHLHHSGNKSTCAFRLRPPLSGFASSFQLLRGTGLLRHQGVRVVRCAGHEVGGRELRQFGSSALHQS
jgi:hypothetical protein